MKSYGYPSILGAIVLFSTIEVVSKYLQAGEGAAGQVGAMQVAALRFMLGAAFLLPVLVFSRQTRFLLAAVREAGPSLVLLGAAGVFLTFYLMHEGIDNTSASSAAVIFSMNPVFTVLIASFALRERLGRAGWLGISIGLAGAFVAVTGFDFSHLFTRSDFLGNVMILTASMTWAAYTVYGKKYSGRYGSLTLSFASIAVGCVFFAIILAIQGGWAEMGGYNSTAWTWLFYLGFVTVGLGYILYFGGMRRVPASRGASLFYLKPVLALLIAHLALGEPLSYTLLVASLMVASGILLVTVPRGGESGPPPRERQ